ncbi:hypothetical protein pb186bvf_014528 [Paramecium bursaria]
MSFQRISADSTQVNYLKNLDDIDDIFNGLVQDDAVDMDQDFEDFLECFSDDEDESQNDSNYHPFPSFRNVSPSFQFSTFADSENPKRHQINRSTPNQGDHQFPHYDENQLDEDSVDEDDDLSDFFESSDHDEQKNDNDVEYIEIKYFEENYKIPIFTAKLFEPEQNADDKLLFQNSDLVNQKIDKIYEFYDHLKKLRLQKFQGDYSFSVYVLQCQQILFDEICKHFNKMLDIQQRWKKLSPSLIFNQRVEQFNLQLNQYKELVKYVFDTSATSLTGRRYFDQQKPAYFQDKKKEPSKKDLTEEEKILQLQQIPYNQNQKYQSNLLSILVFKAQHLQTQFAHFLHHKQQSEKNKFLDQKKQKMKQVLDFIWATRKEGVEIRNSRGKQVEEKDPLILINCLRKHKYKICNLGTSLTKNMSHNYCIANKFKQFEESRKWKNSSEDYLKFNQLYY